jgi:predicted RNA-binding protein with PIN domain
MNVVGSRPDGWWRDREGAIERLVGEVDRWAQGAGERVVVVLEKQPRRPIAAGVVEIAWATKRGRNAADGEIVRRLPEWLDEEASVTVVTSDRELAGRVSSLGGAVEGAGSFLELL